MTRVLVTLARPGPAQARKRALYLNAVVRAGAEVLPVQPGEELPAEFDGLFLTGGGDVHPRRYREPVAGSHEMDEERDELEFAVLERAIAGRVPVLGVCRGFQVLNVALGGSLAQHLEGHRSRPPDPPVKHTVAVAPRTRLESAIGRGPMVVNSWHHQGVPPGRLGRGLQPTVVVDDLIEAFEAPYAAWVVGVQWHPERPEEVDATATRIFDAFVAACRGH